MKCTIAIDKLRARKAALQITLAPTPRFEPPHTELNLAVEDLSEKLGSLVLNCIDLGVAPTADSLFGKAYSFDRADSDSGTELGESVFVGPDQDTFELSRLDIRFGYPDGKTLPIEVDAVCFDPVGGDEIVVRVRAVVELTDA